MEGEQPDQRWIWTVKLVVVIAAVVIPAGVLWSQQTDDALLRTGSPFGAVLEVALWALPGLALYLAFARRPFAVIVEGLLIAVVLTAQWSESATSRSSTASLGPGLVGWVFLPGVVLAAWLIPQLARERPRLLLLIPATVVLSMLGPPGWIVGFFLWRATLRREKRSDEMQAH